MSNYVNQYQLIKNLVLCHYSPEEMLKPWIKEKCLKSIMDFTMHLHATESINLTLNVGGPSYPG